MCGKYTRLTDELYNTVYACLTCIDMVQQGYSIYW